MRLKQKCISVVVDYIVSYIVAKLAISPPILNWFVIPIPISQFCPFGIHEANITCCLLLPGSTLKYYAHKVFAMWSTIKYNTQLKSGLVCFLFSTSASDLNNWVKLNLITHTAMLCMLCLEVYHCLYNAVSEQNVTVGLHHVGAIFKSFNINTTIRAKCMHNLLMCWQFYMSTWFSLWIAKRKGKKNKLIIRLRSTKIL